MRNVYTQKSAVTRYQRDTFKYLRDKGFTTPELDEIRKNFDWASLQHAYNSRSGKSLHELVREEILKMSFFRLKRGGTISGETHYKNIKLQQKINQSINRNLKALGARPREFYRPFDIENITGVDSKAAVAAYKRAVSVMRQKTPDKLIGQFVGSYAGLITSITNSIGTDTQFARDVLAILQAQLARLQTDWHPKGGITADSAAAVALLYRIEDYLPSGFDVKLLYASDEQAFKLLLDELATALGMDINQYQDDIDEIRRRNGEEPPEIVYGALEELGI